MVLMKATRNALCGNNRQAIGHKVCNNDILNVNNHIIIILILHLSVCDVCDVRAGGHGKPFDPSYKHFLSLQS